MHRVEQAMQEIFDYTVALGGSITGEHGVGVAKKKFLPKALGNESLNLLRQFKKVLDPEGILNPGKIFDP
jgi:glycolate oxidase